MFKIGVVGATGYTGIELLRIVSVHPRMELVFATSERFEGLRVGDALPMFSKSPFKDLELLSLEKAKKIKCHGIFLALPHETSSREAKDFLKISQVVVDLSAAFRLKNLESYQSFYGRHWSPELIEEAVYGIPEIFRDRIKKANLIANPGCYPTSVVTPLYPLVKEGLVKGPIFVDAKSGVSGAGRAPSMGTLFSEVNETLRPYKTGGHRHQPEMEEYLGVPVLFSPHLAPMDRGILSSIYIPGSFGKGEALSILKRYYEKEPFVRFQSEVSTKWVRGTNFLDICVKETDKGLVVFSAIDNLVKGASGQAIQNMNLALGLEEVEGLVSYPTFP